MRIINELSEFTKGGESLLTIGVFDGVHRGHAHVIKELTSQATAKGVRAGIVTFRNHPASVLRPDFRPQFLTDFDERSRLIKEIGADFVAPITFDMDVAGLGAGEFCGLLQEYLGMRGLVVGPDFALGRRREGNVERLTTLGQQMGFSLTVVGPLLDDQGRTVRSTAVRESLSKGDVADVAQLLGRHFALEGVVVKGAGRGASLGFPTANLQVAEDLAVPRDGIYATWATISGRRFMAAASIGVRPTFDEVDRTVEAYMLEFDDDVYGQEVRLDFVERLRDEVKYETVGELQAQVELDVTETRRVLQATAASTR